MVKNKDTSSLWVVVSVCVYNPTKLDVLFLFADQHRVKHLHESLHLSACEWSLLLSEEQTSM